MKHPINKHLNVERVGFTGSRHGLSEAQKGALHSLLLQFHPFKEFHHGVCLGADAAAHLMVRKIFSNYRGGGPQIHGWPPKNEMYLGRNISKIVDVMHEPREYKARDREIVWHTQVLIACPNTDVETLRSGTYYTMRQAVATNRPIYFIRPSDGKVITDWKSEMNEKVRNKEVAEAAAREFLEGLHPGDSAVQGTLDREATEGYLHWRGLPSDLDDVFGSVEEENDYLNRPGSLGRKHPYRKPHDLDDVFGPSEPRKGSDLDDAFDF